MQAQAFIIHLERAVARRPQADWLMSNLPILAEILPAVDGSALTPAERAAFYRPNLHRPHYPFTMSVAEIGCFLSHRRAWQEIVRRGLDFGFVIEDDVTLVPEQFDRAFAMARAHVGAAGYIRLPWRARETPRSVVAQDGDCQLIVPRSTGLGMLAQLVSSQAAERLLSATAQFDRPVDTLLQMHWVTGLRPWSVYPNGADEISGALGGSTIGQKRSAADRLRREVLRPIYRARIAIRSGFGQDPVR